MTRGPMPKVEDRMELAALRKRLADASGVTGAGPRAVLFREIRDQEYQGGRDMGKAVRALAGSSACP